MSIQAITGVMGSGKSYEGVSEKIVPPLRDSDTRRVVTNIEGLNYDAIAEFVNKPVDDIRARLISVTYERVEQPGFWYDPEGGVTDTVVRPGDLVVIDEAWRYYSAKTKLPEATMRFFRMHRHYVDPETGHSCDVVIINQALRGLHGDLRDIIEVQYECRKLKALGMPSVYQVLVKEGGQRKPSHTFTRKYNKAVFPLYSSYTHKNAVESVDKRQSAFNRPLLKFGIPFALLVIVLASYWAYQFMHNGFGSKPVAATAATPASNSAQPAPGAQPASGAQLPTAPAAPAATWRVVASYSINGVPIVTLVDESGRYRTTAPGQVSRGAGDELYVTLGSDAGKSTPWTGQQPTYSYTSKAGQSAPTK